MSEALAPPLASSSTANLSVDSHLDRRPTNEYPQTPDVLDNNPLRSIQGIKSDYVNALHRGNVPEHLLQAQSQGSSSSSSHPLSAPSYHAQHEQGILPGPQRVTRAFGLRVIRTVRRGQLPFLLVFFTCVIIFFSALSGLGYEEPETTPSSSVAGEPEFDVGKPVFDGQGVGGSGTSDEEERVERMKRLEEQWAKQKRPKDGAWMKSQRNQREIRRKPLAGSRFQRQRQQEEPDLTQQQQQQQAQMEQLDVPGAVEGVEETRDGEDGLGDGRAEELE